MAIFWVITLILARVRVRVEVGVEVRVRGPWSREPLGRGLLDHLTHGVRGMCEVRAKRAISFDLPNRDTWRSDGASAEHRAAPALAEVALARGELDGAARDQVQPVAQHRLAVEDVVPLKLLDRCYHRDPNV